MDHNPGVPADNVIIEKIIFLTFANWLQHVTRNNFNFFQ